MLFIKDRKYLTAIVTLLLSFAILCGFASCNNGTTPDVTTDVTTTTGASDVEQSPNLDLVKDGVAQFKIIRSDTMESSMVPYVSKFGSLITELTGAQIVYTTDYVKRGETRSEADDKAPAILIGETNYSASTSLNESITTYNGFHIEIVGDQIVIMSHDASGLGAAFSVFSRVLKDHADVKAKNLSLPCDYSYHYQAATALGNVPVCSLGSFDSLTDCGDKAQMVINKSVKEADFHSYVETALAAGLTKYAENKIGNNLFATLTSEKVILNVSYMASEGKLRIIADNPKNTALHPISDERGGDLASTLTSVGIEYNYDNPITPYKFNSSIWQNGMAYIFRLSDGSFIVLDGGWNQDHNAQLLYDAMRSQMSSKDEKITIAAWIFTHVHGDHIGAFRKFMDKYKYEINLDYVIYNTGSPAQQQSMGEITDGMASAANTAISYIPQSRILIARPGQKMVFRNATLEMYHTSELLPESVANGNSLCIAFRIVVAGQSFFFTGDCMTDASNAMVRNYGSALKSDFEQVNHHGAPGPTNELHAAIDPTIVLWPLGEYDYFYDPNNPGKITRSRESYNTYLFESPNVKEIILQGHTTRTLTLPYVFPIVRVDPVQTAPFD